MKDLLIRSAPPPCADYEGLTDSLCAASICYAYLGSPTIPCGNHLLRLCHQGQERLPIGAAIRAVHRPSHRIQADGELRRRWIQPHHDGCRTRMLCSASKDSDALLGRRLHDHRILRGLRLHDHPILRGLRLHDHAVGVNSSPPRSGSVNASPPRSCLSFVNASPPRSCLSFVNVGRGLPARGCYVRVGVGSAVSSRLLLSG